MMADGVELVRAHFESFADGRAADFESQLTPHFRYNYLPPVLGAGAVQSRRWMDLLHRIYATWRFEIIDAHEQNNQVVVRAEWWGSDPVEPQDSPAVFHDTGLFVFRVENGRLAEYSAGYLDFSEHKEFSRRASAH
jgi:hypothetical protein